MNQNEILEVEMELEGSSKVQMKIQESDDWNEIESGTKALIVLVDGQQLFVEINEACEDDGVSFNIPGEKRKWHYDGGVVNSIFTEVK